MTPARQAFINRMRKVAAFCRTGEHVRLSIPAGNLAVLLDAVAQAAEFSSDVRDCLNPQQLTESGIHDLDQCLKQANIEVLPAMNPVD